MSLNKNRVGPCNNGPLVCLTFIWHNSPTRSVTAVLICVVVLLCFVVEVQWRDLFLCHLYSWGVKAGGCVQWDRRLCYDAWWCSKRRDASYNAVYCNLPLRTTELSKWELVRNNHEVNTTGLLFIMNVCGLPPIRRACRDFAWTSYSAD